MKNKLLIIIIALILIVAGFFSYYKAAEKTSINPKITIETEKNKKEIKTEKEAGISICNKITDATAKAVCQKAIKNAGK